ncbi:uncharacterized protein F4822DRAFT_405640 [Hypoxylon trugodes]|uniref:uncharacterized protein n=1 Tax=Hypoxylon trugodes TaxID=326681 RepID=UPI00218CA6D1|nr:uncharacterized protein F4822DRAFT_405640 [Hypoxylon trugodes]KAI1387161.1 hypothetical protein F4822DRAFT_405640 [Hypoxylon trugodes]
MHALQSLILLGLPMAIVGSPTERRAPTSPFGLYAYGDGIGGSPVFTTGDGAFIGKASEVGNTEAAPVEFELSSDNSLVGNPNTTTGDSAPTWSNLTFNVPDSTSSGHQVGFTNSTSDGDRSVTNFVFYGQFLLYKNTDGSLKSLWYAVPSDEDGVWTLNWNSTGDESDGQVIVSLRAIPPSKDVDQK